MKSSTDDRAKVPVPPPLLFVICLGAGIALEIALPSCPEGLPWPHRIAAAFLLSLVSAYLALGSFLALRRHHTHIDPARPTEQIVDAGPFRFSRNPMYLSLLFLHASVIALMGSVWLIMTFVLLFILVDFLAIRPEEKYLVEKFGDEYKAYMGRVRRWF